MNRFHIRPVLAVASVLAAAVLFISATSVHAGDSQAVPARQFEFNYQVHVPAITSGSGPLRIWIPLPQTDQYQNISDLRIESPVAYKIETEPEYANRFAYFEIAPEKAKSPFDIVLRFTAVRREHRVPLQEARLAAVKQSKTSPEMARFLQPDKLVPLQGVIAELARQATQGATDPLEKAKRIYDYVVATMRYDKSGQGWGHGDAIWACTAKRGNCTDFHALFIGMMRASGIPARFEIGFPLPADKAEGNIPGYHCWAEFYLEGIGWIPVDASEAWKNPAKREYFFGAHDVNRIQFTNGRDIRLDSVQRGERLNYFIYPYAEIEGKPFKDLQAHFDFHDLRPTGTAGGK